MARKKNPEDLSVEELRRLLIEKRRSVRKERLDSYRKTGRVVTLIPDAEAPSLEDFQSSEIDIDEKPRRRISPFLGKVFNSSLLLVEVMAVLVLVFVLFNGFEVLRELNQEFASAQVQPTLTPTPLVMAAVLPSGHTPPDSEGGARPNEAEIPEHLRPLVQSLASIPIPTPSPQHAIRIQVPAIGIDHPIVQGDAWDQLKKGVGHHIGSGLPGQDGNMILSAHNDIFGEIFRRLDELSPGDKIIIFTSQRSFTYVITGWEVVEPTQVEVMAPTKDPTATLISCYPYRVDDKRIIVKARLEEG